ncbi:hypothetical protein HFO32_22085 [Rhizobium leguminosarum]|uniref:hypothetical protein n=1 Tax=Rhizobium leguminosarum TaxID=384 RepID=UPI001C989964|nr:hypothetical protein [Rhizobium leguminosarum]MBY5684815.1 hypothetical protein [Rhizobium leguminosarum]
MVEKFDKALVKTLFDQLMAGEDAVFYDPAYPYRVTVKRDGEAYEIVVEDTRKKWWGRVVEKKRTTSRPVAGSGSQGPGYEALSMLDRWVTG